MEDIFHYQIGLSGNSYVEKVGTTYTHSKELLYNQIEIVQCDIGKKWMKVYTQNNYGEKRKEIELSNVKEGDTLDLNEKGKRWEGSSLNGYPFGYGKIFNEDNNVVYEGFMYYGAKVCFGVEFYGDSDLVEFEGTFYQNKRFGYGKLYDKKKEVVYEGEWYNNNAVEKRRVIINNTIQEDVHLGIEELIIGDRYEYDRDSFVLNGFTNLKRIEIGNGCINKATKFVLRSIDFYNFYNE